MARPLRSILGVLSPKPVEIDELLAGEVGFFVATIKTVNDTKIGDTVTDDRGPPPSRFRGSKNQADGLRRPVHGGLARVHAASRRARKTAPQRLLILLRARELAALGFGFRCGFLGLLHMEIIQERLEREYELDLITTAPGVRYHIKMTDGADRGR